MTDQSHKLQLAIDIHGELKQLIAPTTPASIHAGSIMNNPALIGTFIVIVVSIIFYGLYVALPPTECSPRCMTFADAIGILGAAGLGSALYSLNSASEYLKTGTFNPRYNQIYLIRLGTGIFTGLVFSLFAPEFDFTEGLGDIGQHGLAFIGGYSADAVTQFFNRVAETLATPVRGSEKNHAKAKAEKELTKKKSDVSAAIHEAMSLDDDEKQEALKKIIKNLNK